ncbi:MAG: phosphoribosylformylglycinamidine cyclo-ligase [Deltaproteobacteria bacterium]|nr:phosphoribosylformylglycinamidine cyclo-ligase [Deltaproteobacteria bacterium]
MSEKYSKDGQDRYHRRGVSSSKEEVHAAIKDLDPGIFPKAFCKVLPDYFTGDPDYCCVAHADGAGTKSSLAYIYWRETGDLSVWRGIAQDALIMNVDDLICIGAVNHLLASSSIDRNKNLIPGEVVAELISGTEETLRMLRSFGINIYSGGGETADVGDLARTIIVNASVFCRLRRDQVVNNAHIQDGDVIVGLASFGQAEYENSYNAGMGSNGLISARHDLLSHVYAEKYPESFDPQMPTELVYCGSKLLSDTLEDTPLNVGRAILSPTRTYAPVLVPLLRELGSDLHGLVHCSGGGQTKVMNFVENMRVVKDNLFPCPPLFRLIQESSGTHWKEMYKTFNMGHRMEVYLPEHRAERVIQASTKFGIEAQVVGRVERAPTKQLVIRSEYGEFIYH